MGTSKAPPPPKPPPPMPKAEDPAVGQLAGADRNNIRRRRGSGSTVVAGALNQAGKTTAAPADVTESLGGGGAAPNIRTTLK